MIWDKLISFHLKSNPCTQEFREYLLNHLGLIDLSTKQWKKIAESADDGVNFFEELFGNVLTKHLYRKYSDDSLFADISMDRQMEIYQSLQDGLNENDKRWFVARMEDDILLRYPDLKEYATPKQLETADPRKRILQEMERRNITSFMHFTDSRNLEGILSQGGLVTREHLEERRVSFTYTDENRFDHRTNSISLSLSFPNYLMLFVKRKNMPDVNWVVLQLDASAVIQKNLIFSSANAAAAAAIHKEIDDLSTPEMFQSLFAPEVKEWKRSAMKHEGENQSLRFVTDPQTEILCCEDIPLDVIQTVYTMDETVYDRYHEELESHGIHMVGNTSLAHYFCESSGPYPKFRPEKTDASTEDV